MAYNICVLTNPWQPPQGYIPVESKIPGITVYAPAPAVDAAPAQQTFTCPRCGAQTAFDLHRADVTCAHCGYVQTLHAQVVGSAAQASEFTFENLALAKRGWGRERRELHCENCGATLSLDPQVLSTACPFCGSNHVLVRPAAGDGLRPRFLIPFKYKPEACTGLARAWLGRGWMHPPGLVSLARSARFQGIYLPFWTFSAQIDSTWRAEVGYERQERHYDHAARMWLTRTVIDWRWEQGQVSLPIANRLGIGASKIEARLVRKIYPFDMNEMVAYDAGFLAGWQAQAYDIPLNAAWDTARAQMREEARNACSGQIHSTHVRNFSMTADFADESWRYILLPVLIATYRYQDKAYQVLVNGQTGKLIGQKPVAWGRVWAAVIAALLPSLLVALFTLAPLSVGADASLLFLVAGMLVIIGGLVAVWIIQTAQRAVEG
ncbi:MAG: zinc ribbon domain-containing protein [Anaerolineae bacterium]